MTPSPSDQKPDEQREALLDAQRKAQRHQPRNFKEDALTDKQLSVEPDGTGPTTTESFDADADRARGSGNPSPPGGDGDASKR